jgi:formamidopyrimidine-DNA glycosylase
MTPEAFTGRLTGQRVETLSRRGKYVVFTLNNDHLFIHLKMTGRLYVAQPGEHDRADRWLRLVFGLDDGRALRFSDLRKFGRAYLTGDPATITDKLGPEPLSDAFTLDVFKELIARRKGTIKPLLMNQSFVAGVGNIYADEILWRARIDPRRKADTLNQEEVVRLYHALRGALRDGIMHEGASINWYRKPDGTTGGYQAYFNVYDKDGSPCSRCKTPIKKIRVGQRGTHFCPVCQQ